MSTVESIQAIATATVADSSAINQIQVNNTQTCIH